MVEMVLSPSLLCTTNSLATTPFHLKLASAKLQLSATAFAMLTDGVELKQGSQRAWYDKTP